MMGLRDQKWGTELGRLYLAGRISEVEFAAGEWWTETAGRFRRSIGIFPVRSVSFETGRRGMTADPDSEEGRKQAAREANQAEVFFEAHAVLLDAGQGAEQAVRDVCERGLLSDLKPLRVGLQALATHRGLTSANKLGTRNAR